MATTPVSRKLNLTRDQLAAFLTDHQQIKQFELLFSVVDTLEPIIGTDFVYQADTAAANANNALAQISALAQDTTVDDAVLNAKVQQALDAIPRLAQALDLLSTAPRQEIGTIAPQNSDNVNITGGLISGLDAPLPVASGGIGVTTAPANRVFVGPTTGADAPPAFRALVAGDIPALTYQGIAPPVTKTADFKVANGDIWHINNKSGSTCVVTLPAAASWSGRTLTFKNMQAQLLNSASSNVAPIDSTTPGTAILLNVVGNWASMVSDGTNWIIMQQAPNNILLLE